MKASLLVVILLAVIALGEPARANAVAFAELPGSPYEATGEHFTSTGGGILGGAAVGDFNGDGTDDIAVVDATGLPVLRSGESVTILLGHHEGGLTMAPGSPEEIYSGGIFGSSGAIAAADFNGDGKLDLAVVDNAHNTISVLLGDGDAQFHLSGSPIPYSGAEPNALAVGDFNGDRVQDLAFASSGGKVYVLLGDGEGGFAAAPGSPFSVPGEARSLAAGRFDSSGRTDLAVTTLPGQVVVERATGGGHFEEAGPPLEADGQGTAILAGALTGTGGKVDLAVANADTGDVAVLLGDNEDHFTPAAGSPVPVPEGTGPTAGLPSSIVAGDFNGDGHPDLAVANFNGSSDDIAVLEGDGLGGFANAAGSPVPARGNPRPLVAGDFNGDGHLDLAAVNSFQGTVTALGNGTPKVPVPVEEEPAPRTEESTRKAEETHPELQPPPPAPKNESSLSRTVLQALLAVQMRTSAQQVSRLRVAASSGAVGIDWHAPAAGAATVKWYAGRASSRDRRARPVLIASGFSTSAAPGNVQTTMRLTRAGRRLLRQGRRFQLRIRVKFVPVGQAPVYAAVTATLARR